ncbi:MAG: hypothetical protein Q9163_005118 [Psora crenata]
MTTSILNLPANPADWTREVKGNGLVIKGPLADYTMFQSGSEFKMKDFQQLRILHQGAGDIKRLIPLNTANSMKVKLRRYKELEALRQFYLEKKVKEWVADDSQSTGKEGYSDHEDSPSKILPGSPIMTRSRTKAAKEVEQAKEEDIAAPLAKLSLASAFDTPTKPTNPLSTFSPYSHTFSPYSAVDPDIQAEINRSKEADFVQGDEQTINACLVAFIMPITWMLGRTGSVHHDRVAFKLRPRPDKVLYTACVDGIITEPYDLKAILGIIEVKPGLRVSKINVRMQEGAEMAAFIQSNERATTKGKMGKWMVSMGGYEGYITLASYDSAYVDFLNNAEEVTNSVFMRMTEYGPFNLAQYAQLEKFLVVIAVLIEQGYHPS